MVSYLCPDLGFDEHLHLHASVMYRDSAVEQLLQGQRNPWVLSVEIRALALRHTLDHVFVPLQSHPRERVVLHERDHFQPSQSLVKPPMRLELQPRLLNPQLAFEIVQCHRKYVL